MIQGLLRLRNLGFAPTGILDVGAYEGDFCRTAKQIFKEAHVLMIDALAEKAPALEAVCRELGNAEYLIAMLGDQEMSAGSFFVAKTDTRPDLVKTGSSKYRENSNFPMEQRQLPQRTLASILGERRLSWQLLKLDVQGAELDVVRGLGDYLSQVEVILTEMSLVEYNRGAPLMDAMLSEFRRMGFVLFDILEEHRTRDGSLLQVDGVFVRPDSRFRRRPPFWS